MLNVLDVEVSTNQRVVPGQFGAWSCAAFQAGSVTHPAQLANTAADWISAASPGTVASMLQENGQWSFDEPVDIDAADWWFRTTFSAPDRTNHQPCYLCFDGLATLAEVWLNGSLLLSTDNMFRAYRVNVADQLQPENQLAIRFRSAAADLQTKRPRPRWKTNLVNHQQLRWQRTSLQGRIPGWSPAGPAVGPWRSVRLECSDVLLNDVHLQTRLEGTTGVVSVTARLVSTHDLRGVWLRAGNRETLLEVAAAGDGFVVSGEVHIERAPLWWPHTHGEPALLPCEMIVIAGDEPYRFLCSDVGFRDLQISDEPGFGLQINGVPIYCRGACWTVSDLLSLTGTEESLRHDLRLAREAGVNLLRVGGTTVYESELFYQLCDEYGILVWQDFMFANMDYPVGDSAFLANVTAEAEQQLRRLAVHPSVAVYCGNSEIEQQAAMLGMPREVWRNDWFGEDLPALCAQLHPGTGYVPSTPSGGVLPFHVSAGITHYYGIGAYLRAPGELRQADVKFTPECLGFANVPEPATVDQIMAGAVPVMHHPRWKSRIPRDTGAGWDFEDVRDHYLRELYGLDPIQLRSWDPARYLQLSRLVSGEMMTRAFSEWRSSHSRNRGGLVWFFKDLWPASGWGIVDSNGMPKAAYYFLKRVWNSRQLTLTDEGLNGLHLHLINETDSACAGSVEVVLLKEPHVVVARQELPVQLPGRTQRMLSADEVLGGFYDVSYAYRFGPPHHDVAIVTWYDEQHQVISEAFHHIRRQAPMSGGSVELQAAAEMSGHNEYRVTLRSNAFLHGVRLAARGFLPSDNYFHLPPERSKTVTFTSDGIAAQPFKVDVEALNLEMPVRVVLSKD